VPEPSRQIVGIGVEGRQGQRGLPNFRFTLNVNIGPSRTRPVVVSKFINMPPASARVRNFVASKETLNGTALTVMVGLMSLPNAIPTWA
jgi:hypothetical protein